VRPHGPDRGRERERECVCVREREREEREWHSGANERTALVMSANRQTGVTCYDSQQGGNNNTSVCCFRIPGICCGNPFQVFGLTNIEHMQCCAEGPLGACDGLAEMVDTIDL
jgi:hypothetical protein